MSDFTKEELLEILGGLDDFYLVNSPFNIGEKIQFLIDHYETKVIKAWHCEKCGHLQ